MAERFNDNEIRRAINVLKPDNALFEIRIVGSNWTASGYFTDAETCIRELNRFQFRSNANVYILPNEIDPSCYQREQHDCFVQKPKNTTSDKEVLAYKVVLVDIDAQRISGTSATDEQVQKARELGNKVYCFLRDRGFNRPLTALSGNGVHLVYKVDAPATDDNKEIVKKFLLALDALFSTPEVKIDTTTHNQSRIIKLYGTMAQKGANTKQAPHRMAQIVSCEPWEVNSFALFEKVAALLPEPEKPQPYNNYHPESFNLEKWLDSHNIQYRKDSYSGGSKYVLDECPFDPNHKAPDAAIFQSASGAIGFHCFHNSCSDKKWRDVRKLFDPQAYERTHFVRDEFNPNYRRVDYQPKKISTAGEYAESDAPTWYTTKAIAELKRPPAEYIKTGITVIDQKMRGLEKGTVTCLSGLRSAGKSSLVSEVILNAVEQGYKVALFSGELTAKRASDWMALQAAGKNFVKPTNYENFYLVDQAARKLIDEWLNEKLYVYNNDMGNRFNTIMKAIESCVTEHKIDLVVADNLMAIDISGLDKDKYARQSLFVETLENYAKAANIAIVFVAHPRKANGFLRLDDISGSGDITNRVDNCFIIHRVNEDFKRLTRECFKWPKESEIYYCDNCIEICKDRQNGTQDCFIPLFFEKTCKRLLNDPSEHIAYGWQELLSTEQWADVDPAECPF